MTSSEDRNRARETSLSFSALSRALALSPSVAPHLSIFFSLPFSLCVCRFLGMPFFIFIFVQSLCFAFSYVTQSLNLDPSLGR